VTVFRQALQDWQTSKHYKATETLPDEQMSELLAEGDKQRESFGWAMLTDKSIGFSIGVPTKLVKFIAARPDNGGLWYDFEGPVRYTLHVRYGDLTCANLDAQITRALRSVKTAVFKAKYIDGFAIGSDGPTAMGYMREMCRSSGSILAAIDIAKSLADKQQLLFSAMADSLSIDRGFNPTAIPRPKLDTPTPTADDLLVAASTHPRTDGKAAADIDKAGKTDAIKRETRDGANLSVEQVFEKVSPAVYMVKADTRVGSAVAISEHELLTNCHVVKDLAKVILVRDKAEQAADVVSVDEKADRCILKAAARLDKWVTVRPYDDNKVGEGAITVGTPQGLELTVAEGIVSSKRTHEGSRLVQTTAAISQGSSGGGLFDAQGRLLGITTFYLKVGQNLNFALAAEDFAK